MSEMLVKCEYSIFISYPTENREVSESVETAFKNFGFGLFNVFLDRSSISSGGSISQDIKAFLRKADFFIGVGPDVPRENFSWCGLELGYFQKTIEPGDNAICAIYDTTPPDLFKANLAGRIEPLNEDQSVILDGAPIVVPRASSLFKFFSDVADRRLKKCPVEVNGNYFDMVEKWAEASAVDVTDAYCQRLRKLKKETWYSQARIEVLTDATPFWKDGSINLPANSKVRLDANACHALDIAFHTTSRFVELKWAAFVDMVTVQEGALHLTSSIAHVIRSTLPNKAGATNDVVFRASNGKPYRLLLIKHSRLGDGTRSFVLNLVEQMPSLLAEGERETSLLTAAVVLAAKYRFSFLERESRFGPEMMRDGTAENDTLLVQMMLHQLQRIHQDASRDGLSSQTTLVEFFGDIQGAQIDRLFQTWWPPQLAMQEAAVAYIREPAEGTRAAFLKSFEVFTQASETVNRRFTALCLAKYQSMV